MIYKLKKFIPYYLAKKLISKINKGAGRNFGTITCRHKGGGFTNVYRYIDFNYNNYLKISHSAIIINNYINYSNLNILSLILYISGNLKGKYRLILKTHNTIIGDIIYFDKNSPLKLGSPSLLGNFLVGTLIHSIEGYPTKGSELVRAAGTSAIIISQNDRYRTCIKLPSGKLKLILKNCIAILGSVAKFTTNIKKNAGFNRQLNKRPTVRGLAMNSVDHPHGGGVGRTSVGLKSIKTPWGKYGYGIKTRKRVKIKSKFLI